jgi:hypothetical protein
MLSIWIESQAKVCLQSWSGQQYSWASIPEDPYHCDSNGGGLALDEPIDYMHTLRKDLLNATRYISQVIQMQRAATPDRMLAPGKTQPSSCLILTVDLSTSQA